MFIRERTDDTDDVFTFRHLPAQQAEVFVVFIMPFYLHVNGKRVVQLGIMEIGQEPVGCSLQACLDRRVFALGSHHHDRFLHPLSL